MRERGWSWLVLTLVLTSLTGECVAAETWKPTEAEKLIAEDPSRGLIGAAYLDIRRQSNGETYAVRVRAKILSKKGFEIGTVEGLDPDAYDIEGRTIGPTGKVTELAKGEVRKFTTLKTGGVSLERKAFTLPALEPGCFIEYAYREHGAFGPGGDLHTEVLFQAKYPILRQELRVVKPSPFSSSIRTQNGVDIEFREESRATVFTASNAPAIEEEPYGLPIRERAAVVIFARVFGGLRGNNADEFWRNATKDVLAPLIRERMVRPGRVQDFIKSVPVPRDADPFARAKALYDAVRLSVRNTRILRAGETPPKEGWKSNKDAGEALERKYGTSSDLALLFASLLRAERWPFRIVFAPDREERFFRRAVPSVFQFGGWLVTIEDPKDSSRTVTVSFEHPLLRFGDVPWSHLGVDCWSVNPEDGTGKVVKLPQAAADQNARRRKWTVTLTDEGEARMERASSWSGQRAFEVRVDLFFKGKETWQRDTREEYRKMEIPGEVESVNWQDEEKSDVDLQGSLRVVRRGIANVLPGGRLEFSPVAMLSHRNPFTRETRNGPVFFPFPYLDEDTFTIGPPAGWKLDGPPPPIERNSVVGRYGISAESREDGTVLVRRRFELKRSWDDPDYYESYRNFFDASARGDAGFSLIFRKADAAKR